MHWSYWLDYLVLLAVLVGGLFLNVLAMPGNWLMLAGDAIYAWVTQRLYVGKTTLIALLVLAIIGEVLEQLAGKRQANASGGGRWGSYGALIGGFLGGFFLTFSIPVVGTLVGILLGTFGGAMAGELIGGKDVGRSVLIGVGAAKGRAHGVIVKIFFGCVILVVSIVVAFPWPNHVKT